AHKSIVGRQRGLSVTAIEMNCTSISYGGVTVGIQRRDGAAEGTTRNAAGRSADAVMRRGSGADTYQGITGDRAGEGINGGEGLAAGGPECDGICKGVNSGVTVNKCVVGR